MRMRLDGDLREYSAARDDIFTAAHAREVAYGHYSVCLAEFTAGTIGRATLDQALEHYRAACDAHYAAVTRLLPAMPRAAYRGAR